MDNNNPPALTGFNSRLSGLCSPMNEGNTTEFLTGTNKRKNENLVYIVIIIYEIYLIEFCEENNTIIKHPFSHNSMIWFIINVIQRDVTCSNLVPYLFSTISSEKKDQEKAEINQIQVLDIDSTRFEWNPSNKNLASILTPFNITIYDISANSSINIFSNVEESKNGGIRWNPHSNSQNFVYFNKGNLNIGDIRTSKFNFCLK
ncbi:hypothetical protein HZS_6906 [Henneguya salminicola]|nr:hypothetical protein HZS_6906 [Henneguya salminicola]